MQSGLTSPRPHAGFPPTVLEAEGLRVDTGAPVTAALALGNLAVTAHGDGSVRMFEPDVPPRTIAAHDGVVLAVARAGDAHVITAGDDGRLVRTGMDGQLDTLAEFDGAWIDCVAAHPVSGLVACSVGRAVHVWRAGSTRRETFTHPSTVGGLAFDPKGTRLAVAHYGGATVWERGTRRWTSTKLTWAGSHIGITWSPNGKYVITSMQENALHGWRLRDKADMRMSGYPAKPRAVDWVGEGPHLATSGADRAVCWPFHFKNGPMGQPPICVADGGGPLVTRVCAMPGQEAVLAGFQDGAVLMSEVKDDAEDFVLRGSTGVAVTGIAVTPSLSHVLIGDAGGTVLWAKLRKDGAHARTV